MRPDAVAGVMAGVAAAAGFAVAARNRLPALGRATSGAFPGARARPNDSDRLFKAVHDISTEGIVVYRADIGRDGQAVDFVYRYANPAACSIMEKEPKDIVGERLLERLPEAREHPQLFQRYAHVFATGETSEVEYQLGGRWLHSTVARLDDGVVVTVRNVSARRQADDVQRLMLQELNHRVKNLLASVIAMVAYTERGAASVAEFRDKLSARLDALARAHGLLSQTAWTEASVGDVVRNTLEPHLVADSSRFQIDGGAFTISSETALALNMALYELATNAAKYGALSEPQGTITIDWMAEPDRPGFIRADMEGIRGASGRPARQTWLRRPFAG